MDKQKAQELLHNYHIWLFSKKLYGDVLKYMSSDKCVEEEYIKKRFAAWRRLPNGC